MPLSDDRIIRLINEGMIEDALLENVQAGVISSGLTSSGYDLRCGYQFKVFRAFDQSFLPQACRADELHSTVLDPKNPNPDNFLNVDLVVGEVLILQSGEYALTHGMERMRLPRNIVAVILGKSTYARSGIVVNATPGESGWEGWLTIEIFNASPQAVAIYPGEGICQVLFFEIQGDVNVSYADRDGKYNRQGRHENLSKVK